MAKRGRYLVDRSRLADVIAAIQILGSYKFASRTCEKWEEKLDNPSKTTNWKRVFEEHPEFFRVSKPDKNTKEEWISLRWRHGYDSVYHVDRDEELTETEINLLTDNEKRNKLSRRKLTSDEIETLINTAIALHGTEIAYAQEKRWLIPIIFTLLGVILGASIAAFGTILKAAVEKGTPLFN